VPVIPGRAEREPGIHRATINAVEWIPGSRQAARPGMTAIPYRTSADRPTLPGGRGIAGFEFGLRGPGAN